MTLLLVVEASFGKRRRIERLQIGQFFADSDKFNRSLEFVDDADDDSPLGSAIKFSHDEPALSTYETSPLPTIADKLLFILTDVQQNRIQAVSGQLFEMFQSHANKWIHLLHAVLNQALAHQEWLPARTADDLATLLAAKRVEAGPRSALFCMMGPNDPSTARTIPRTSRTITVASRRVTHAKTAS